MNNTYFQNQTCSLESDCLIPWGVDDAPLGEWVRYTLHTTKKTTHKRLFESKRKKVRPWWDTSGTQLLVFGVLAVGVGFMCVNGHARRRLSKSACSQPVAAYVPEKPACKSKPAHQRPNVTMTLSGLTGAQPKHVAFACSSLMASTSSIAKGVSTPPVVSSVHHEAHPNTDLFNTKQPIQKQRQRQKPVHGLRKRVASWIGFINRKPRLRMIMVGTSATVVRASLILRHSYYNHYDPDIVLQLSVKQNFTAPYSPILKNVLPYISRIIKIQQVLLELRENYKTQFAVINAQAGENVQIASERREAVIHDSMNKIKEALQQQEEEIEKAKPYKLYFCDGSKRQREAQKSRFSQQLNTLDGVTEGLKCIMNHELVTQQLNTIRDMVSQDTNAEVIRDYVRDRQLFNILDYMSNQQLLRHFNWLMEQESPATRLLGISPQFMQEIKQDLLHAGGLVYKHNTADGQSGVLQSQRNEPFPFSGDQANRWKEHMVGPLQEAINYVRTKPEYRNWYDDSDYTPSLHKAPKRSIVIGKSALTGLAAVGSVETIYKLHKIITKN